MTDQQWSPRIRVNFPQEESVQITVLQDHSGKDLDISKFSVKKNIKGYVSLLYHIDFSKHEDLRRNLQDLRQKDLIQVRTKKLCTSLPCRHWIRILNWIKRQLFMKCATTQFRSSFSHRSSSSKMDQQDSEKKNMKRSNLYRRKRVDKITFSRGISHVITRNKTIDPRQQSAVASTAEIIKEIKDSEVYVQCNCCFKKSRSGTVSADINRSSTDWQLFRKRILLWQLRKTVRWFNHLFNFKLRDKSDETIWHIGLWCATISEEQRQDSSTESPNKMLFSKLAWTADTCAKRDYKLCDPSTGRKKQTIRRHSDADLPDL